MKSKLRVALAVAGCMLVVSPANAISVTYNPGATTSSVPGAVLFDDFDSIQNTAIGTITSSTLTRRRSAASSAFAAARVAAPALRSPRAIVRQCRAELLATQTWLRDEVAALRKQLAAARAELHRLRAINTQRDPDATLN